MSIAALQALQGNADRSGEARDRDFQRKVAAQNFLRHHAPIVAAHMERGPDLGEVLSSDGFAADVEAARSAAMDLTARLAGKRRADVTAYEARHLRAETVRLVASRRRRGLDTDPAALVEALAHVPAVADRAADADAMDWKGVSPAGSFALTAMRASLALLNVTDAYDFRLGRERVLAILVDAAADAAKDGARAILGDDAPPEDLHALFQSAVRDVTMLLRTRYEVAARETVGLLSPLEPAEREAWHASNDPLGDMLAGFRRDAAAFMAMAARMVRGHGEPAPAPAAANGP